MSIYDAVQMPSRPITQSSAPSLREHFAVNCPAWWMGAKTPRTYGQWRDELLRRGMIARPHPSTSAHDSFTEEDCMALKIRLCWEYADAMMAERGRRQ